jgi:hypothetical protein
VRALVSGAFSLVRGLRGAAGVADDRRAGLLERTRRALWLRRYSPRTAQAYVAWVRRFIVFSGNRHPITMGAPEVTAFLSCLADDGVSINTESGPFCPRISICGGLGGTASMVG